VGALTAQAGVSQPAVSKHLGVLKQAGLVRDRERETSQSHFLRLRDGTAKSIETSSIHLDTIRDLKQINSLLTSMAYPVLEEQGLLRGSRLKAS
jgi:phosphate:Na+ symporter